MFRRLLFQNFRWVFNFDHWIRQHFTKAGSLILSSLIAATVFGIDTGRTFAYQLFSLLLALLLLAFLSSWFFKIHLSAKRHLPRFATVGETLHYRVRLSNHTKKMQHGLFLLENLKIQLPDFKTFLQAKEPCHQARNWFDNCVGYPRWLWLMHQSRGADATAQQLPALPPNSILDITLTLTPLRRGYVHFTGMTVACPDPLGLFNAIYTIQLPDNLLILPTRYPVGEISLPGSCKYQRGGVQLAMSVGDAQEFMSLRDYRPGDPLRHIHWKSWAKTGTPVVKEFQDEFFIRHALILDTFIEQAVSPTFEAAVSVAASLVCAPRNHEVLLDLMFVGPQAYCFTSGRGVAQHDQLLETLACVTACTDQPFSKLSSIVMEHASSLSGCVCIFLSWDAARRQLVQSLKNVGVSLLIMVITETELEVSKDVHLLKVDKLAEGLKKIMNNE